MILNFRDEKELISYAGIIVFDNLDKYNREFLLDLYKKIDKKI